MARLLIEEYPLVIIPSLANKIGLNQAIFLQQVHYWVDQKRNIEDEKSWVYNTYEEWQKQFPFWSVRTLKRIVSDLESLGLIISTTKYNKRNLNQKKWYTIDYDKFNAMFNEEIANAVSMRNSSKKDNKVTCESKSQNEEEEKSLQKIAEKGREILQNKCEEKESNVIVEPICPDPLSQPVTLDNAELSPSIAPICPDRECQNDTLDSDKIAIPTYITENTTEIITDNTTETSYKNLLPLTPSEISDEGVKVGKVDEKSVSEQKNNVEFQRLFKLFEKMHHTPNANETRKLHLIFEAQGDKAMEYAILCSENAKSPIGYIVSVLKDKSIFSVFNKEVEGYVRKDFNGETRENRCSRGFSKYEKRARDTDCLPESEEESKFNNFHW